MSLTRYKGHIRREDARVVITEPGEPEVLQWLEVPDLVPGRCEVAASEHIGKILLRPN